MDEPETGSGRGTRCARSLFDLGRVFRQQP
jgi:hypothetical protein